MPKLIVNERPFDVGDEVFEFVYGIGKVCEIHDRDEYSIVIDFANFKELRFFKPDGIGGEGGRRCLFHLDVAQELGFVDMEINVTELFKPEVGQLYYRPESNEVLEYVKDNEYLPDSGMSIDYLPKHMANAEKIQELDRLNIGDSVYIFSNHHKKYIPYGIDNFFYYAKNIYTLEEKGYIVQFGANCIAVDKNGKGCYLYVQAYRNKHRAERFGAKNA